MLSHYFDVCVETYGRAEASDIFSYYDSRKRAAKFKFRLMRFTKGRETFRHPDLKRPIRARYNGRAVFVVN